MADIANTAAGYLVSVPVPDYAPLALHATTLAPSGAPVALYLHDLAVLPTVRGHGVAEALIRAYLDALTQGELRCGCLTAVNASSGFWQRYGFRVTPLSGPAAECLATYGQGAQFMMLDVAARTGAPA
jgi:ribosomal protein S18 acetylase RimI-like enzyme